jgi:hypothetical protein
MNATRYSSVVGALLVCGMMISSVCAAAVGQSGDETSQTAQKTQRPGMASSADRKEPNATSKSDATPGKASELTTRGPSAATSAVRTRQETSAVRGRSLLPPAAGVQRAGGKVPMPAVGAATHIHQVSSAGADRPSYPANPGVAGFARAANIQTTAAVASQQATRVLPAPIRSGGKPLQSLPGSGVIGGPHAVRQSMVGGPGGNKIPVRPGIDGTALRHRY